MAQGDYNDAQTQTQSSLKGKKRQRKRVLRARCNYCEKINYSDPSTNDTIVKRYIIPIIIFCWPGLR